MSTKQGTIRGHRFHGDPKRFQALADFIAANYSGKIKTIADVGGGQGMLARILNKKYNFDCEVIDPRGNTLVGVPNRQDKYQAEMAEYYDLIVGLHPDEALSEVVFSALIRPTIVIPCCNFWSKDEKLSQETLLDSIEKFYQKMRIGSQRITFGFVGPKNIGFVSRPAFRKSIIN